MSIKRRLFSLVAASAVATTTAVLASTGAASAAPGDVLGPLVMTPANGNQSSLIDFTTQSGVKCPANTGSVQVTITGQTLTEANPGIITGNTDYSLAQGPSNNLKVPGGVTMASVFSDNGITTPSGDYTFHLQCIDGDSFAESGRFDIVTHWTATGGTGNGTYVADNPAVSTSTVLAGPTSAAAGANVTYTATLTPSGATGTVQFKDGAANLGAAQPVSGGVASFSTTSLSAGPHNITAQFIPTGSFGASSSNTITTTISTVSTSTTLVSNTPTQQAGNATFTATVSPDSAGTVSFVELGSPDVTLGSAPVNAGQAVFSTSALAPGTHNVKAVFTPANPGQVTGSESAPVAHVVESLPNAVTENLTVSVPAGALTMVLNDGEDGNVDLGVAEMDAAGDKLTAEGDLDPVKVTDTRAGDPGWTVFGVVSNFSNGTDQINGFNLGWTPAFVSLSANQQAAFQNGAAVAAGTEGTPSSTPGNGAVGLKTARVLGQAPDNSGNGTAVLGAHLNLNIPTDVSDGTYAATLTLTVVG